MTKNEEKYMGKQAKWSVRVEAASDVVFTVNVKIVEVREKFGRVDLKVEPLAGTGQTWVGEKTVELMETK